MKFVLEYTLDTGATWKVTETMTWEQVQRWIAHETGLGVVLVTIKAVQP